MNYSEMKTKHRQEINALPIEWAFNKRQLQEALKKLGTKDTTKLCTVPGGGIMLESDATTLMETIIRHESKLAKAMNDDEFAAEAIRYELENHEGDVTAALKIFGLEWNSMSKRLKSITLKEMHNVICRREHVETKS